MDKIDRNALLVKCRNSSSLSIWDITTKKEQLFIDKKGRIIL
jgi:hypothetical protein